MGRAKKKRYRINITRWELYLTETYINQKDFIDFGNFSQAEGREHWFVIREQMAKEGVRPTNGGKIRLKRAMNYLDLTPERLEKMAEWETNKYGLEGHKFGTFETTPPSSMSYYNPLSSESTSYFEELLSSYRASEKSAGYLRVAKYLIEEAKRLGVLCQE